MDKINLVNLKAENHTKKEDMKTLQVSISESDIKRYNLGGLEIKFTDLVDSINRENTRRALLESNKLAEKYGLSELTWDAMNAEIKAVREEVQNVIKIINQHFPTLLPGKE